MIPKTIHYIWFGGNELSELTKHCIASWEKYCPDYEIIRWDESNFDVVNNQYCKEACEAKKWAFASDYARLWILVNHGGIYMDTDVELLAPLDPFLHNSAFSGFEAKDRIPTGLMAAERGHPLFTRLLANYDSRSFIKPDGSYDTTTNVEAITETCLELGLRLDNTKQTVDGFTLYPSDFFCPKNSKTLDVSLTENSAAIHHFDGSWLRESTRVVRGIKADIRSRHPKIPVTFAGVLANLKYVLSSGDVGHALRLLEGKTRKYYKG